MSDSSKAVFLSYASQDKEAALRICDALRAAGVEVWFDQSELAGGDAWDAKIRGQIGSCALFVPIISANTQARLEGYFRLEWKLAAQRTHTMADEKAFLLPVVIDDTKDAVARVPAEFKSVQWTRLPGGETPPAFVARVKKLLSEEQGTESREPTRSPVVPRRGTNKWWWALPIFGVTMALLLVMKEGRKDAPSPPAPVAPPDPKVVKARAPGALVLQGREMLEKYTVDDTQRESLTLAEELAKRAVQADATDAAAWSLQAQVATSYITTARDRSPARFAEITAAAERAMQLAPDSDEALLARAIAYRRQTVTLGEAERILRDLVQRHPDDRRILRALGNTLRTRSAHEESLVFFRQSAALPGGDARAELFCAEVLQGLGRLDAAAAAADRSLAVQPTGSARLFKVNLARLRGDLALARAELAKMPPAVLLDDRGAAVAANVWLWSREPDKVIAALQVIPGDDLYNAFFYGPKSLMLGFAHEMAGRKEAAKAQWRIASANIEQRVAANPAMMMDPIYLGTRMFLDLLGGEPDRKAGATQMLRIYVQQGQTVELDPAWDPIKLFTLIGREDILLEFMEVALASGEMTRFREELRNNRRYDPLRGNPRFEALFKEPAK